MAPSNGWKPCLRPPIPPRKALVAFTDAKPAEGLSQRTVDSCLNDLSKWIGRTGERGIGKLTRTEISAYLSWLRTEYQTQRFGARPTCLPQDNPYLVARDVRPFPQG